MKPSQEINELMALFASAMIAVATKLIKASKKPSLLVIIGEVLIGLAFCFILAPAMQEYFGLSIRVVCAMTWVGAYFSGILLTGAESVIRDYFSKIAFKTPKNNDSE